MKNPRNEFFQLLKIALLPKKDNKYFPTLENNLIKVLDNQSFKS